MSNPIPKFGRGKSGGEPDVPATDPPPSALNRGPPSTRNLGPFGELDFEAIGIAHSERPAPGSTRGAALAPGARDPYDGLIPVLHDDRSDDGGDRTDPAVTIHHDAAEVAAAARDDEIPSLHEDGNEVATKVVDESGTGQRLVTLTSRAVPRLLVDPRRITELAIGPKAAFLLGHIDGLHSMEEILDVCAMPESDALQLIDRLRAMGVIGLE